MGSTETARAALQRGLVIPACPLALNSRRHWDERRQRALFRYYLAAGAGGVAVGVHTTQFAIRAPAVGLFRPLLELAADEFKRATPPVTGLAVERRAIRGRWTCVRVAGICGRTPQAVREASLARDLGYDCGLVSLGALKDAREPELLAHCRAVGEIIPLMGFYLQPAVGGRLLPCSFWRRFAELEPVVAIKIAPFNRYQTLDVVRAVAEVGRHEIALYTGNDDHFLMDLLTPFRFNVSGQPVELRMVGGLLGHWAVWTQRAVKVHAECRRLAVSGAPIPAALVRRAVEETDANAAFFDAANGFAGCIPGIHEVLRRQGLLAGNWCLDRGERLSPGQREEIDRVCRAYPHLNDDQFVRQYRDEWLRG